MQEGLRKKGQTGNVLQAYLRETNGEVKYTYNCLNAEVRTAVKAVLCLPQKSPFCSLSNVPVLLPVPPFVHQLGPSTPLLPLPSTSLQIPILHVTDILIGLRPSPARTALPRQGLAPIKRAAIIKHAQCMAYKGLAIQLKLYSVCHQAEGNWELGISGQKAF